MSSGRYGIMPCMQPSGKKPKYFSAQIWLKLFQVNIKMIDASMKNIQLFLF